MRRGTTPTVTVTVDADLTGMDVHLALNAGTLIVKETDDLEITVDGGVTTIVANLTQADTLSMTAGSMCEVQVRAFNSDGSVAMATDIGQMKVCRILEDGELPQEDGGE